MIEKFLGFTGRAVVFTNGSSLPFTQVRSPSQPPALSIFDFRQALLFKIHLVSLIISARGLLG